MKKNNIKKVLKEISISSVALFFAFSCATTSPAVDEKQTTDVQTSTTEKKTEETKESKTVPVQKKEPELPIINEIPEIVATRTTQRIELESMYTEDISFEKSEEYSGYFAGKINSNVSCAKAFVIFEPGSYEILIKEKAEDNDHATFFFFMDNEPFRLAPSDPPLNSWELTTRFPITFKIEESKRILFTIQANSPKKAGQTGMMLDFIQIRTIE